MTKSSQEVVSFSYHTNSKVYSNAALPIFSINFKITTTLYFDKQFLPVIRFKHHPVIQDRIVG